MTKSASKTEAKTHKSSAAHSSISKPVPMLAEKEVYIKQEPLSDDEDSIVGTPSSLSVLLATAKGTAISAGPVPGTRDFAVKHAASKGAKVVTPMKMMKTLVQKSHAKASVKLMSFNIFGDEGLGEKDHTVALAMGGDFFALREQIKAVDKKETEVNGVCIPMVQNALSPRFISNMFLNTLIGAAPEGTNACTKILKENFECLWFIFAPKVGDEEESTGGAASASISAAVTLDEYALIWRHALQGKPVHFDSVEHIQYYIGVEELELLQQMHTSADPHFGKRSSSIRK